MGGAYFYANFVVCCFIGAVKVWDPRQKNDPVATMEPGEGEDKRDCWTVSFGKSLILSTEGAIIYYWGGGNCVHI